MADTKTFKIQINGITESINAVDALNKQLQTLESRIKALEKSNVKVGTTSSSSSGSKSSSSLSEEAKLAKQIEQIDAKREAYSKEIYQNYLAAKDVLDETVKDQKAIAAQERYQANSYSNTIQGLKQRLKDIQAIRETTDMASDDFKKLTSEANNLVNELNKLDQEASSFGRNVGSYKSAFEGMDKVTVTIAGVTQEFNSLRQAARAISNQMGVLEDQGKQDTQMYKELERELGRVSKAQLRLNSAMKDAKASSKVMDDLLDNFESFTAIGHLAQSFSTLFGFDSSEMEKQIAKLVALEGVLKDIEKIRQQMNTQEGIGKIFANASKGVDKFVANLGGAEVRMGKIVGSSKEASIALNNLSSALKGVGGVAIVGGIMLLTNIIGNLINNLKKWYTAGFEAGDATKLLGSEVQMLETRTKDLLELNVNRYFKGMYTDAEALSNIISTLSNNVTHLIDELRDVDGINFEKFRKGMSINTFDTDTIDEVRLKFKELAKEIENIEKTSKNSVLGETITSWFKGINGKKRDLKELGNIILNDFLARAEEAMFKARQQMHDFNYVTDETISEIEQLRDEVEKNTSTNGVLSYIEKFCGVSDSYKNKFDVLTNSIKDLSANLSKVDTEKLRQLEIDAMADSEEKIRKQNELNRKKEISDANFNPAYIEAINKKYDKELQENLKAYRKTKKQEADQKKKEEMDVQREIDEYTIQLMKEGLDKQIAELRNEEKYKRKEIEDSGIRVSERVGLVNEVYGKKIEKLTKDWAIEMKDIYDDLLMDITKTTNEIINMQNSTDSSKLDNQTKNKKESAGKTMIGTSNDTSTLEAYYKRILEIEEEAADEEARIARERLFNEKQANVEEEKLRHERLVNLDSGEYAKQLEAGKITQEQFNELIEKENAAHYAKLKAIDAQYTADSEKILQDSLDRKETAYSNYYQSIIATIRKEQDDISKEMSNAEVKDSFGIGVINIKATQKNYDDLIEKEKESIQKIQVERAKLFQDKDNMKGEDFLLRQSELDAAENAAMKTLEDLEKKQKEVIPKFMGQIAQYASQLGSALGSMLQAFGDYADQQFENTINDIEKDLEKYEELLDKQKEITEQHKSEVDSIEDELSTARGDRRQRLIDQLNAEMAAQRASLAEEKRIENEEKKLKDKKDREEQKRLDAQKRQQRAQAVINGAVAFMNALAQQPIWLGIAMAAMTAAMTAVQIATIDRQKYADGGVIEGKSHSQGGVKILGGHAEVEGNEFITNKRTTAQNTDLLYYINSKKKRLDLGDFIEFYGGESVRKNISSITRSKYADGGQLPTLRGDIDVSSRLVGALEDYSNRPVQVAVVDIIDKTQQVNDVKVMAGLEV